MLYLLTIGIIVLGMIAFFINKRHVLNPGCIACAVFFVSCCFAIYSDNWGVRLHGITVFVILSSLSVFIIGTAIGSYSASIRIKKDAAFFKLRVPSFGFIACVTLIMSLSLISQYNSITNIARQINRGTSTFGQSLYAARVGLLSHEYDIGRTNTLFTYINQAITYICIYFFFYCSFIKKQAIKRLYLLLPCIPYLASAVLSTGRTKFIYFLVYTIMVGGIIFFQTRKIKASTQWKIIRFAIIGLIAFMVVFSILQTIRNDTPFYKIFDVISFYTGMSIPALDDFLMRGREASEWFGGHTLFGIYNILRTLGFSVPELFAPYDAVVFNGVVGNVYTAFRRYIEDYTLIGNYIILLILGFIASYAYFRAYKKKGHPVSLILFAWFIYPVAEISIEERVMMTELGMGTVYSLIAFWICWGLLQSVSFIIGTHRSLRSSSS